MKMEPCQFSLNEGRASPLQVGGDRTNSPPFQKAGTRLRALARKNAGWLMDPVPQA